MAAAPRADALLPTGTVTFLFTDLEGSTALWERDPVAMQAALARHDRLLRHAIESVGGHIVKTTGDGVLAAFAAATDGLAACLAAQRALQGSDAGASRPAPAAADAGVPISLKVRMGLHTGVAESRDGDYFGVALNRAARIMSAAHGEQVLVSAATAELVRGELPEGVTLREMGEHRLKGMLDPERLLQVVAPDLRSDFPPLQSQVGHSLPAERDAFVGRREPLAELSRRLETGARLVSVLGLGGAGKTRLVTRFGWNALPGFPGGVWFCDLSEARSADGILHAVAQGLDVPLGKDDPVTQLGHAIAGRGKCLVILDNFEQVARHAEETLGRWLNRAGAARFLVTTREVLGLPGENVIALASLPPDDAAALFLRRAEAAKPGFVPNGEDQAAIPPLVKLLEGLPLAIELAAARVRVMPPRTLLARMSERFTLLASTGGRLDRQATLRAVFDWSWDLLSLPEKAALAQLSVFEGGFTLESAEAILDLSAYDNAPWPMDALQSLVQKSLVRHVTDARFDLLVSVQEYVAEHLRTPGRYAGSGPAALLAAERRHGAYFAGLDERAVAADGCAELDNLVAACRRAAARGDADMATRALEGAWAGLDLRGPFRVGVELASLVQAIPGLAGAASARASHVAGSALDAFGRKSEARVQFEASLAQARETGDRHCECRALASLALADDDEGHKESARTRATAALAIASEVGDSALQGRAHDLLGNLEESLGRPDQARAEYQTALALMRKSGDPRREGNVLGNLANAYSQLGLMDEARSSCQAALAAAQQAGNRRLEGNTLCNLGLLDQMQGRFAEALARLESALAITRDIGHVWAECIVLCNLGIVHQSLSDRDEAQKCFEASLALARDLGHRRTEGQIRGYLGLLHAHAGRFDEARGCLDSGEALLRSLSDRTSLGILLCSRAETECLAGVGSAAKAALEAADACAVAVNAGPDSELGLALARVRSLLGKDQRLGVDRSVVG
jgi:predicted ATPase/class 3 adenylate cyclase/Tfp pilus assembly protein PilF